MQGKVAIIGYSGHGIVVADTAIGAGMPLQYYCEKNVVNINPFGLEYLGDETDKSFDSWDKGYNFILGVGDNNIRSRIAQVVLHANGKLPNVIHRNVYLSKHIELGIGNFISANATINALSRVGDFCILNTGCIIEHECLIANGAHIGPGAVLAGSVQVGSMSFVGANASIKQGIKIGANVIIGAGTVVITDIPDNTIVAGNPARNLR
ncbi:acetyltransferase [Mucilaginibacter rigui]|uniref:Acetyltransferase n=1 Tax=Mucilaginibacter rigui TaxID=534635 RepID=A0ABR7X6L7_9SPHI|nr:acetyltransferase [Mucilaginibacter rigui]MBD1386224.1 acetyltransferase [Mucilaginibacter rigui]